MSAAPSRHSSKPELNRPPPLGLSKESRKMKKQKAAPPPAAAGEAKPRNHPPPPVIIYTLSPKVFRVDPEDFKSVVQRLTGSNSSSSSALNTFPPPPSSSANDGGVSAAAQLGSTGNVELPEWRETQFSNNGGVEIGRDLHSNETDSDPTSSYLHGNTNVNNLLEDNINFPSSSSSTILDVFNYFYDI